MEAHDVLADDVNVGGPAALQTRVQGGRILRPQQGGQVPQERVEPHVNHLRIVTRHRDAPIGAGARNRKIALVVLVQPNHDLASAALGQKKIGVVLHVLGQLLPIFGQPKKVILLTPQLGFLSMDLAHVIILHLVSVQVRFASDAIPTLVILLVNVAAVQAPLPHLRNDFPVFRLRGPRKMLVTDVKFVPQPLEVPRDAIHELLWGHVLSLRSFRDLFAMFVHASHEMHIPAAHLRVPGHDVRGYRGVRAADVRSAIGIE
mmetsp:Transcript_2452/g.7386  ORF Transcript_2452/g.7386 Transcript_2452/m.7386 type:complete len:260 (-) Transcript_2452:137-916(-)